MKRRPGLTQVQALARKAFPGGDVTQLSVTNIGVVGHRLALSVDWIERVEITGRDYHEVCAMACAALRARIEGNPAT